MQSTLLNRSSAARDTSAVVVMMHQGNAILDKKGEEKDKMSVDDILALFNEISIECGN